MPKVMCEVCSISFNKDKSKIKKHIFCLRACFGAFNANKVEVTCDQCGLLFKKKPTQIKRSKHNFCSSQCHKQFRRDNRKLKTDSAIRSSFEYKIWRSGVFERDSYTCNKCGEIGGELQAHHILGFAKYKDARFKTSNGVTLCKVCHKGFHDTYTRVQFTEDDYIEWIGDKL